jgi:hypothetical protein
MKDDYGLQLRAEVVASFLNFNIRLNTKEDNTASSLSSLMLTSVPEEIIDKVIH